MPPGLQDAFRSPGRASAGQGSASPTGQSADPTRPSLLALAQPLWSELSSAQRSELKPFEGEWNTWSATEKRAWISLVDRLPRMDAAKREKARHRIVEWSQLSPEQRALARANYRLAKERPADARVNEWERYRSMTEEQQIVLRRAGSTSNTAAGHAGAPTGLAKEAAQPLPRDPRPAPGFSLVPAAAGPGR